MKSPKVSVITLNLNGWKDTSRLLQSLRKTSYKNYEIIVVDNGSRDDSVQQLRKEKGIRLITLPKNLGFSGGNNVGVSRAKGAYIALLNNDAFVEKEWLSELVQALESDAAIGVVGAYVKNRQPSGRYEIFGYGTTTLSGFFAWKPDRWSKKKIGDTFSVSGGAMLFRRKDAPVPFPDEYFAYHEDTFLCWRLRLQGRLVKYVAPAVIYHEGGATRKREKHLRQRLEMLTERNRILNLLFFYQGSTLLLLLPHFIISGILINLFSPRQFFSRLNAYCWLLSHPLWILRMRRQLQARRKVKDSSLTPYLSAKIFEEEHFPAPLSWLVLLLNALMRLYLRLAGIKTIEQR